MMKRAPNNQCLGLTKKNNQCGNNVTHSDKLTCHRHPEYEDKLQKYYNIESHNAAKHKEFYKQYFEEEWQSNPKVGQNNSVTLIIKPQGLNVEDASRPLTPNIDSQNQVQSREIGLFQKEQSEPSEIIRKAPPIGKSIFNNIATIATILGAIVTTITALFYQLLYLSLIHISEPTRPERISYAVF